MWWNDLWPWSEVKGHRSKILFSQIAQKHWERETSLYCRRIRNHVGFHLVKWPLTLVQGQRSIMSIFGNNSKVMRDRDHSHIVLICRKSHTGFHLIKYWLLWLVLTSQAVLHNSFIISVRLPEWPSSFGNKPGNKHLFFQLSNTLFPWEHNIFCQPTQKTFNVIVTTSEGLCSLLAEVRALWALCPCL